MTGMLRTWIDEEFDSFFEFDTDDRSTVTSTSCRLFAAHVAEMQTTNLRQQLAHMTDDAAGLLVQLREAERQRDELALIIATDTGTDGAVAELQRQRDELREQLAASQKREVMLRDALVELDQLLPVGVRIAALDATEAELSGLILCEREPVQWTAAGFCDDGEPLYRAARRPE